MNLDARARAAAEGLRSATTVNAESGLARLRRTHRRRGLTRVAASVAVLAGLAGGGALAINEEDRSVRPAEHGLVENGIVVDSVGGDDDDGETPPSKLAPLADATPYPVWQAFDQDSGRFLFTGNEGPGSFFDSTSTVRVLAPGLDAPVATITCDGECHWPAFGPGPDEVTALVEQSGWPPRTAHVYGFDGSLRDEIDVSGVWEGGGVVDIAWSPDGSRLAVSTFTGALTGAREPSCLGAECAGRVWILDRAGGDPVLLHRQDTPGRTGRFPPLLMDLAWAPDGERLALISAAWLPEEADPPRLVVVAVKSGQAETIREFDDCGGCNPASYGFAWSPDGTRIAVTDGAEIAQLSSDGTTTFSPLGSGKGPIAWLDQAPQ